MEPKTSSTAAYAVLPRSAFLPFFFVFPENMSFMITYIIVKVMLLIFFAENHGASAKNFNIKFSENAYILYAN